MSLSAVPSSWDEPRLAFELDVISDEVNFEYVTLRDQALSTDLQRLHVQALSSLVRRRRVIQARLRRLTRSSMQAG